MAFFLTLTLSILITIFLIRIFLPKIFRRGPVLILVGVQILVAGISTAICYHSNTSDVEIWNGTVIAKKKVRVSCSHSYSCGCYTDCSGSGKDKSCSTLCSTCYHHDWDWDWRILTSNSEEIEIDRVDDQGSETPPRWSQVIVGEPTAVPHQFTNYIKASPDSLFRRQGQASPLIQNLIPPYPQVRDYYRIDRLLLVNGAQAPSEEWNESLNKLNAEVGAKKQINVLVVLVRNLGPEFFFALEQEWIGGKKNDCVIVIGTDDKSQHVLWARAMVWSTDEKFRVKLLQGIQDQTLDPQHTLKAIRLAMPDFERKPMRDFEYLQASITPTLGQWISCLLVSLGISSLLSWVLYKSSTTTR